MTKLLTPLFLIALSITIFSCQKEADFGALPDSGSAAGGDPSDSYLPLTTGTWWRIKDSASGAVNKLTVLAATQVFKGITYKEIKGELGAMVDTAYMAAPRPNYYFSQKGISPGGASYDFVQNILNDTASVGYTWDYNGGQGNGFAALMKATIVERNISLTIGGKTFTNVIHTQSRLAYDIGIIVEIGQYDYYLAKGVGIVRARSILNGFGTYLTTCADIVEYEIK